MHEKKRKKNSVYLAKTKIKEYISNKGVYIQQQQQHTNNTVYIKNH